VRMGSTLVRGAFLFSALGLFACSEADEQFVEQRLGDTEQAIIGGAPADAVKYAAVGALVYTFPEVGVLDTFCTGTLVAKKAIVTARHCTPIIDEMLANGLVPAIAFGPDPFTSTQVVTITGYVNAPPSPDGAGLLLDGGRDVAVAYLESAPAGIKPVKLGQFDDGLLGKKFQIAGFGWNNAQGFYGQLYSGNVTARALKGKWYSLLFDGDYEEYLDWYFTDSPGAARTEEEAKEWWKIYKLENKYELLAGGLPNDAVGCFGDSGGPLLRGNKPNDLTTYGVSFATEASISRGCDLGGAYLVFNKKMLDFVEDALEKKH
jgi:trypsin